MPRIEIDHENDITYFIETDEEKNKREIKEQVKEKTKGKKANELSRAEKDELIIAMAKLHGLIE